MQVKHIWKLLRSRYRLSTKTQMNFEISFPCFLVGNCRAQTETGWQVKKQKVSPSLKGLVFSDTIPWSWFTFSALIPWETLLTLSLSDTVPDFIDTSVSSDFTQNSPKLQYATLTLAEPENITLHIPWSQAFTNYVQSNQLMDISPE